MSESTQELGTGLSDYQIRNLVSRAHRLDGVNVLEVDLPQPRLQTHIRSLPPKNISAETCICHGCPHHKKDSCPGCGSCSIYLNSR